MSEEKIIVVCSQNHHNLPGTAELCEKCDALIWLSKSTVNTLIEKMPEIVKGLTGNAAILVVMQRVTLLCAKCAVPGMTAAAKKNNLTMLAIGDEQKKEITDHIMKQGNRFN